MGLTRGIYAGVSGLRAHQVAVDVIGNNIANVNTTAFKASRVTFQDLFSQTLKVATSEINNLGGTNPNQVGIGVQVGSIDVDMTQGSLESTGRPTDVAIQGDGFFMVSPDAGDTVFYTRDGNFSVNADKELVDMGTGYKIMGWQVGNNTTNPDPDAIDTTYPVTQIEVPIGTKKKAQATNALTFASNLNAASDVRHPNFARMYVTPVGGTQQELGFTFKEIADTSTGAGTHTWEYSVEVLSGGGSIVGDSTGTFVLNTAGRIITVNGLAVEDTSAATITVKDATGNQAVVTSAPVDTDGSSGYTFTGGWTASNTAHRLFRVTTGAGLALDAMFTDANENDLELAQQWQANGTQQLRLEWTKGSNAGAATAFNPQDAWHQFDPNYWQYTLRVINGVGTVAGAASASGALIFGDSGAVNGGLGAAATFALSGGGTVTAPLIAATGTTSTDLDFTVNSGQPNITGTFLAGDVHRTSVETYDSLGQSHNVTYAFYKAGMDQWDAVVSMPFNDPAQDSLTGNYATLTYDSGGKFSTIAYDNPTGLATPPTTVGFTPAGANTASLTPDFALGTQYEGDNTVRVISQNGYAMGILEAFTIESSGVITGVYENGLRVQEAQIGITKFRNPEGMERIANNTWRQSPNSGIPMVGTANTPGFGEMIEGSLETSNVDLAREFTNLILVQRGFQANTRIITTIDELLTDTIGMKR